MMFKQLFTLTLIGSFAGLVSAQNPAAAGEAIRRRSRSCRTR